MIYLHPLPPYEFMVCTESALPLFYLHILGYGNDYCVMTWKDLEESDNDLMQVLCQYLPRDWNNTSVGIASLWAKLYWLL
jgi:hypothetical protein